MRRGFLDRLGCIHVGSKHASIDNPISGAVIQPRSMANAEPIVGVYRADEICNVL